MSTNPDEIRADIERTRADLSDNVNALAEEVNPKNIARRQTDKVKDAVGGLRDKVMGSAEDTASTASAAVSSAPDKLKEKTQGNPLAAGIIAFGVGMLVSALIPSSQREQQAAATVKEKAQPLVEDAKSTAQEMAEGLREPAQEAARTVKEAATGAVDTVREQGQSAARDVGDQARSAGETVRQDVRASG